MKALLNFLFFCVGFISISAQSSDLFIPALTINDVEILNTENVTHLESDMILDLNDQTINIVTYLEGINGYKEDIYGALLFDYNNNELSEKTELIDVEEDYILKGILTIRRIEHEIKLTPQQLALLAQNNQPITVLYRISTNKELLTSADFKQEETASILLKLRRVGPPIGEVKTGEGDQRPDSPCIEPIDTFFSFFVENPHNSPIRIDKFTTPEILPSSSSRAKSSIIIPPKSRKDFRMALNLTEQRITQMQPCFDVSLGLEYRFILEMRDTFIDDDTDPYIVYDTIYSDPVNRLDTLNYCYCEDKSLPETTDSDPITTSIQETIIEDKYPIEVGAISIFPNPFIEFLNVQYKLEQENDVVITMSHSSGVGSHVLWSNLSLKPGNYTHQFEVNHLPNGVYLLTITTGNYHYHTMIVKYNRT